MSGRKTTAVLILSGAVLFLIGIAILLFPHQFYASNGTILGDNPNLLSEVRASGGLLFACSLMVLGATFQERLRQQALIISAVIYLAYGFSRVLSMLIDGIPSNNLTVSTGIELFFGAISLYSLRRSN